MKHHRSMKLRDKLFLSYIFIMILPLLILGSYSYIQAQNTSFSKALSYEQNKVDTFARTVNSKINTLISGVNAIAYNSVLSDVFNTNFSNYYDMYDAIRLQVTPVLLSVQYANEDIDQLAIYTDSPITKKEQCIYPLEILKKQPWYSSLASTKGLQIFMSDQRVWFVNALVPTYYNQYESYAVLTVDQGRLFDTASYWQEDTAFALYRSGKALMTGGTSPTLTLPDLQPRLAKTGRDRISCLYQSDILTLQASSSVLNMDFMLCRQDHRSNFGTNSIILATIAITISCSVFVMLISYLLSKVMVYRLELLNQRIQAVDRGSLDVEFSDPCNDEIGQLSDSFNHMLHALRRLIDDIYNSERSRKRLEINLIHAKIKPHFLYNILSVINSKAIPTGNEQISEIALAAASFYRTSLNDGKHIITVEKELENVQSYIKLQKIMHSQQFESDCRIDSTVLPIQIPNFILQPIVENAIKHGLDNKRVGVGLLYVSARMQLDQVVFEIQDNGPGMPPAVLQRLQDHDFSQSGYGIQNVYQKLELYYRNQFSFDIQSAPQEGTTVRLTLPITFPADIPLP